MRAVFFTALLIGCVDSLLVRTSSGTLSGTTITSTYSPFGNQTAHAFLGIPFATPPIANLRFQKPRPPVKWQGILKTQEYAPACMSDPKRTYKTDDGGPISEDCLYLNVFTNEFCFEKKNCSVMVIVHGGRFLFESASAFDPHILINNFVGQNRNIIVVTLNYRMGVFGFANLNGLQEAGNLGFYDILEGLHWVHREIKKFGGDPKKVTLAGHSAGATLTFLFNLSPLSKGLVHQQILMSTPFHRISKSGNFKATTSLAIKLGCMSEKVGFRKLFDFEVEKMYECLQSIPAEKLLEAQLYVNANTTYTFGDPFVDGKMIPDYPDVILSERSNTPMNTLLGTTSAEMRDTLFIDKLKSRTEQEYWLRNICEQIGYQVYLDSKGSSERCVEFYLGNAQFLSDDMEFYTGTSDIADGNLAQSTKVFLYSYTYSGAKEAFNNYMPEVPSPHHSEDLIYIFGTHRGKMTTKDYEIERIYSGFLANFVNSGTPSKNAGEWKEYSSENREHFVIDFDDNVKMPGMMSNYYKKAVEFWRQGDKKHTERFATSMDYFLLAGIRDPIISYLNQKSDNEKSLELNEKIFFENEQFLNELKDLKVRYKEEPVSGSNINIYLIVVSGVLLIAVLYFSFIRQSIQRYGYQRL